MVRDERNVDYRWWNGRLHKITRVNSTLIDQWRRRNNEGTSNEIVENLLQARNLNVSQWTVQHQLNLMEYEST
jgi:hypothetical protein